jgi:stage II sporulation protein E
VGGVFMIKNLTGLSAAWSNWGGRLSLFPMTSGKKWREIGLKRWSVILSIMGFLLGRAMILQELFPFAIAFFAIILYLRKDLAKWIGISLFLGASTIPGPANVMILAEIILFLIIQKEMARHGKAEISYAPVMVLMSVFPVHLAHYIILGQLVWYTLAITMIEATLSFILTLIFIQALQVFSISRKNMALKHEEIICLIILLASVMTGTVGWMIGDVSIEHVASRYLILVFALVGGGAIGATVGVIIGLILSLSDANAVYQMSTLAFAGLLAGLFKEGKRLGVTLGMVLGTSILTIYLGTQQEMLASVIESAAAIALFLLTPKSFFRTISSFVPGTQENIKSQQDYAKKVRDITAGKVQQFSEVFRQLSSSFNMMSVKTAEKQEEQVSHFMNLVADKACQTCWKRKQCWENQFYSTYRYMTDVMTTIEMGVKVKPSEYPNDWTAKCVKVEQVQEIMVQQYEFYHHDLKWKKQLVESRQLVAEQLTGVSRVMEDLAREIQREGEEMYVQEEQIREALEGLGLSVHRVEIICLDEGDVDIEITHQSSFGLEECRKIVAPLLSEILGENIAVLSEPSFIPTEGYYTVALGSAREYDVETGVAGAAKGGSHLSGDSFSTMQLGNGKFAVAISDGMGNGERAQAESSTALQILQQLLQSGMDETLAIKSVNSVLLVRSSDEVFATVDLALIDLYDANTKFLKIGSTPSFIKRGDRVTTISANNLPIGILSDIDVEMVNEPLEAGDLLVMMTDGIFDAPGPSMNKELWIKRMIQEIDTKDPQQFADCLLEKIVRHLHGEIQDDMTVVVTRIDRHIPEWATFKWPGISKIERNRSVS